jgi:hypothetical protein
VLLGDWGASVRRNVSTRAESKRLTILCCGRSTNGQSVGLWNLSFDRGFGLWILVAGLSSAAFPLWAFVGLIPIVVGLLSGFGPS